MLRIIFLTLVLTSSVVFAQTQENKEQKEIGKSYIFAELGKANSVQVKKQFGELEKQLIKDFSSQGYIINYGTAKEIAKREKQLLEFVRICTIDSYRLTFVRGGNGSKLKTIFWIVPTGATPPAP